MDFGEAEEEKGFVIAEVSRGGAEYEFHSVDVRPFVDILIEEDSTPDITERFLKAIAREDIRDAVVKIRYIATEAEVQNLDLKRINEALKPAHYKLGYQRIPKDQEARRRSVMLSQDVQLKDALRAYLRSMRSTGRHGTASAEGGGDSSCGGGEYEFMILDYPAFAS